MWALIAEMVLALGLIVFIFWWTMRARVDKPLPPSAPPKSIEDKQAAEKEGD
jgi:hypothetical protein